MDVSVLSLTVPPTSGGWSYGLQLRGTPPVMVSQVEPRSPAEKAGLQPGDFLVDVNGQDVVQATDEKVWTTIKHYQGAALRVRVGRPNPPPASDTDRRRAVIVLQTKLDAMAANSKKDYKATVQNAFMDVQDILGSLGGGGPVDANHSVQEVKLSMGCDDSDLSSPPDSSNESEGEFDELLDFTKDDAYTHKPGAGKVGGGKEMSSAQLVKSVMEAQRALEDIKTLTQDVTKQKEIRKMREERKRREDLVWTESGLHPGKAGVEAAAVATTATKQTRTQPEADFPPPPVRKEKTKPARIATSPVDRAVSPPIRKPVSPTRKAPSPPVKTTSPPPVPPYNPSGPDRFPLSNKPDYRIAHKKETHTYERVDKGEIAKIQSKGGEGGGKGETVPKFDVPLRRKKPKEAIPSTEEAGHVKEPEKARKLFAPQTVGAIDNLEIKDMSSLRAARRGLPQNVHDWRREDVGVWLSQLSPTLHKLYYQRFSEHDIIGRTLIRLSDSKLRAMGISTSKHSCLLARQIAGLKIQQEASELRGLGEGYHGDSDEEEDREISYL